MEHVFVHIWDDNASVYASEEAFLAGTEGGIDLTESEMLTLLAEARRNPGEAVYLDDGMSCVRYLSIGYWTGNIGEAS